MKRRWVLWTILAAMILLLLGIIVYATLAQTSSPPVSSIPAPAITASDHTYGNASAKVTLIEYGDFECPSCGSYFPIMQKLMTAYSSRVLFVFRNFPLAQHSEALPAAYAAEAAGLQGKYWQMHDLLYEHQLEWSVIPLTAAPAFTSYAKSLGLNLTQFQSGMNSPAVKTKVATDIAGGQHAGVDYTPSFFLNLKQIPNPRTYDEFETVLDKALAGA